jgi:hypothetical protein
MPPKASCFCFFFLGSSNFVWPMLKSGICYVPGPDQRASFRQDADPCYPSLRLYA